MRNHFRLFFCTDNFVINREHNLFSRNNLLYFHYVIKELVHAFSCAYIELWMHLGSLESTQEARVARGVLLRFSCALQTSRVHPQLDIRTLSMNQFLNVAVILKLP